MEIEQLGEIGLIERIAKKFRVEGQNVTVGEDDCAVIEFAKAQAGSKYLVVTTDTLQESTHLPEGISPFQIGWSAVAVNLSDIAAMGARPYAFTIAMGIPAHTDTAFVDAVVEGIEECASSYGTIVVGGDLTRSKELILTGTCFGFVPRIREGINLANSELVTSMIDISDGLSLSLAELAKRSNVGFELYEDKVPVLNDGIRSVVPGADLRDLAFFYGGDYELLFTVDANTREEDYTRLQKEVEMTIMGKVVRSEEGIYIKKGANKEEIDIRGYQHFTL